MTAATPNPVGERIATFITQAATRTYDDAVVDMAKRCLVDWMGVAIGAKDEPVAKIARKQAASWRAQGSAQILLGEQTTPALAAFVNATMGHALDFDDTRGHSPAHLSSPTWSAVLALSDHRRANGGEALNAFIAGYEIAAVLGDDGFGTTVQRVGFHPTGVFGRLSAAAASAVMLKLDARQSANAIGLAATSASGLTASFGTMAKPFHSGKAAMDGVHAAQLAADGFEAAHGLFDNDGGFADSFVQGAGVRFDKLEFSNGQSLFDNSFKPYACGKLIHGHIDAARELRDKVASRKIVSIHCAVAHHVTHLVGRPAPTKPLQAKFSISFCVALALCAKSVSMADFNDENFQDLQIRDLMSRTTLEVVDDVGRYGSRMRITLEDGDVLHAQVPFSLGNPENPMDWNDLKHKFDALVEPAFAERSAQLYDALRVIDDAGGLAQIFDLIKPT